MPKAFTYRIAKSVPKATNGNFVTAKTEILSLLNTMRFDRFCQSDWILLKVGLDFAESRIGFY